jgi:RNA polymerase sigma-70 factor (ECF subfamily)
VTVATDRGSDIEEVYREVSPTLWRALYAYAGGLSEIADDATAEAFARLIVYAGRVSKPKAWLYRTAFRIAAEELRRRARSGEPLDAEVWDAPDTGELAAAMRRLSPSQRAAVYLHYSADLPVREVARLMGTSSAAVKVHLHRGRNRLRDLLGEED